MKHLSFKYLIILSIILMIISFTGVTLYLNYFFDFRLAETYVFLSAKQFVEINSQITPVQCMAYLLMATTLDVIWPVTYSYFFIVLNNKLITSPKKNLFFKFYIIFMFVTDMFENFLTAIYLIQSNIILSYLSVIATNVKWLSILSLTLYYLIKIFQLIRKKQSIIK